MFIPGHGRQNFFRLGVIGFLRIEGAGAVCDRDEPHLQLSTGRRKRQAGDLF
jgi:hypothetical protein